MCIRDSHIIYRDTRFFNYFQSTDMRRPFGATPTEYALSLIHISGYSKKESQQTAAQMALQKIKDAAFKEEVQAAKERNHATETSTEENPCLLYTSRCV